MGNNTWKQVERRLAQIAQEEMNILGMLADGETIQRTGPTGRDTEDIAAGPFAVEVKHRATLPRWLCDAFALRDGGQGHGSLRDHVRYLRIQFPDAVFHTIEYRDIFRLYHTGLALEEGGSVSRRSCPGWLGEAWQQACANGRHRIPVLVLHKKNSSHYMAIVDFSTFGRILSGDKVR